MRFFVFVTLALTLCAAQARVPVEERSQPASPELQSQAYPPAATPNRPLPAPSAIPDTFSKIQLLQEEVMELRGMVEQLSNEVRQLKQRQADDYMELDRRISSSASSAAPAGSASPAPVVPRQTAPTTPRNTPRSTPTTGANADYEVNHYSAAYGLLKDGKIPQATTALQKHISDFPNGKYTANAYYWLGEIYLLENKLSLAKSAFSAVVEKYPAHRKAPDATFKLGKVLHMMGDNGAARTMLNRAVQGGGSAGKLAEKYLSDNF